MCTHSPELCDLQSGLHVCGQGCSFLNFASTAKWILNKTFKRGLSGLVGQFEPKSCHFYTRPLSSEARE